MSKKVSYHEVLGIMKSGEAHINLYKKHDPEGHRIHMELHEEAHGLLHAHECEAADDEQDQESLVSFYYEDEEGCVQKKMVKR